MSASYEIGTEKLVNTTTAGAQDSSSVTGLADGGWVVTWVSAGQDGSSGGIYQQRYTSTGMPAGGEIRVNTTTTGDQADPTVAKLADGGWVVTWTSPDEGGTGIYQQRFGADGVADGKETLVNNYQAGDQDHASVTGLEGGGWVVTWTSTEGDGSHTDVHQQAFAANGQPMGGEFLVNTITTNQQGDAKVVGLADGGWITTWSNFNVDTGSYDIVQRRFDSAGAALGGETVVNSFTTADQVHSDTAALPDGGWVVTWSSYFQDDGKSFGVYQQRFDKDGVAVGNEVHVSTTSAGDQLAPSVAALSDGGWVVSWTSQDENGYDVYRQRFDSAGNAIEGEQLVNHTTTYNQFDSHVASLADGGFLVSWTSAFQDGSNYGVYAQRFGANGAPVVGDEIADQGVLNSEPWTFQVPAGTFTDPNNDALTYSATLGDGTKLPDWLHFDPATQTFTGTPPADFTGTLAVKVTAADAALSVSDTFNLTVSANQAPFAGDDFLQNVNIGSKDNGGEVLSNDSDPDGHTLKVIGVTGGTVGQELAGKYGTLLLLEDGSYTYDSTNTTLPEGPTYQDVFTYTVSDGHGGTASATLTININSNQSGTENPDDPTPPGTPIGNLPSTDSTGYGDFNGNGKTDFLFRNSVTHQVESWSSNGAGGYTTKTLAPVADNWTFVATGDVDGDGNDDVVFQDTTTGVAGVWIMRHDGLPSDWRALGTLDANTQIKGAGDFDQNGTDDLLLWNSSTGSVDIYMQGKTGPGSIVHLANEVPTGWTVSGVGDLDGNGTDEVLLMNTATRHIGAWQINDGHLGGWLEYGTLAANWEVTDLGNFDGKGQKDIGFYNASTGEDGAWLIHNGAISDWLSNTPHDAYTAIGVEQSGSGAEQVLWHNPFTGNIYSFQS